MDNGKRMIINGLIKRIQELKGDLIHLQMYNAASKARDLEKTVDDYVTDKQFVFKFSDMEHVQRVLEELRRTHPESYDKFVELLKDE